MKLSIIMPVYNSKKYLSGTIESVLSQAFDDFELILVDDGSEDGSGEICDEYAMKDARVRVIHKENEGICPTRNRGMREARGEYIGFCDNDDFFFEGLLADNYALAKKYDADVVRFSRQLTNVSDGKVVSEIKTKGFADRYVPADKFALYFDEINNTGDGIWAGIYRREFLMKHNISFCEDMRYGFEDLYFVTQIYMCQPSVVLNSRTYYNWMLRTEHSTSAKTDINNIDSLIKCLELKKQMIDRYDLIEKGNYSWAYELSKRIYYVVQYVSPKKVDIPMRKRLDVIRYFAKSEIFAKAEKKKLLKATVKYGNRSAIGVNFLFLNRFYRLLYMLITK